jgi:CheY-like chemotaxis protein
MKLRALVLDDNDIIRSLLSTILMKRGYEVRSFSDPGSCPLFTSHECFCTASEACTDIILSDVRMPHVSGLEFVSKLLKNGCKAKNIAFISGSWTEEEYKLARELGCKTFQKPFDINKLEGWFDECEKNVEPDRVLTNW